MRNSTGTSGGGSRRNNDDNDNDNDESGKKSPEVTKWRGLEAY